ncbi:MAG: hypothetical protein IPH35_08905 [Rhodoferax sp.]|nr:hypothetical protein [Rhodoferax sp.]
MKNYSLRCLLLLAVSSSLLGCNSLLPSARTQATPFQSFEEAKIAIKSLVPMQTSRDSLQKNGVDPASYPNTKLLSHADVVRLLIPSTILRREDLDKGILACLEASDECYGLSIELSQIDRKRDGNFLADFSNFERRTETQGWRFNALVLLVHEVVVYRSWGGQPWVNEIEVTTNPLGPFQNMGPGLLSIP